MRSEACTGRTLYNTYCDWLIIFSRSFLNNNFSCCCNSLCCFLIHSISEENKKKCNAWGGGGHSTDSKIQFYINLNDNHFVYAKCASCTLCLAHQKYCVRFQNFLTHKPLKFRQVFEVWSSRWFSGRFQLVQIACICVHRITPFLIQSHYLNRMVLLMGKSKRLVRFDSIRKPEYCARTFKRTIQIC